MKETVDIRLKALVLAFSVFVLFNACQKKVEYYTTNDFESVKKTDAHLHINTPDSRYLDFAARQNFRIISPNVDAGTPIGEQMNIAAAHRKSHPENFAFLGTFSVDSFGNPGFVEDVIRQIDLSLEQGASGIKIWKNIGMALKDSADNYVMVDDAAFDPIFQYIADNEIPLMGHLGEPRNCWLPLEQMTDSGDYRYFKNHPEYHMLLHPEAPSYEDQINARDNLLRKFPDIAFIGAHIGSLEWNLDEVAKRLDEFPSMSIDLSARIGHVQRQSIADYEKVLNFFIRYQDRILYGIDITISEGGDRFDDIAAGMLKKWKSDWAYLATDSVQTIENISGEIKGLHLPKTVVNKIYYDNANRYFNAFQEK